MMEVEYSNEQEYHIARQRTQSKSKQDISTEHVQ